MNTTEVGVPPTPEHDHSKPNDGDIILIIVLAVWVAMIVSK